VQDRRFRDVVSLRRLYPEVAKFLATTGKCRPPWGILSFDFWLLAFDLRALRALCPSAFICGSPL
jgi:hypothetical protein